MSKLLDRMKEIVDCDNIDVVIEEARKKLAGTLMLVNDEVMYVHAFDYGNSVIKASVMYRDGITSQKKNIPFVTLDVWLPETGIYQEPTGGHITISKMPNRQWYKSFRHSYYSVGFNVFEDIEKFNYYNYIAKQKPVQFIVTRLGDIVTYPYLRVGHVLSANKLACVNKLYMQELGEFAREVRRGI